MAQLDTRIVKCDERSVSEAAAIIQNSGLVGFPTETVYGLGANAFDEAAVLAIFKAKDRPADNPLIVHISDIAQLEGIAAQVTDDARALMKEFWPGALSLLMKKTDKVPGVVTAGLDTVAVRMPDNAAALALINASGVPIAAPSANLSGLPSPTRAEHVFADMRGKIPLIIDGGPCRFGVESTVADVSDPAKGPVILRPGAVTKEMIEAVCGRCAVSPGVVRELGRGEEARSPGMKHRHYSPTGGRVIVIDGEEEKLAAYVQSFTQKFTHKTAVIALDSLVGRLENSCGVEVCAMGGPEEYAAGLFDVLRRLDGEGFEIMLCQAVAEDGIGLALMNRLLRAAGFHKEMIV